MSRRGAHVTEGKVSAGRAKARPGRCQRKQELMKAIIRGLVLGLLTVSTFAYPDYEPFNYPVGVNLVGQTSPDLLTWTAAGPPGLNVVVQAGNLTVPGLAAPAGNQVLVRGALGPSARFPIGPTINTGTVFFSFALRVGSLGQLGSAGDFLATIS